ncbi:MAG: SDR family NAD(P)-dependent oxidoreductase [Rhizomicrobium sp.]
MRGLTGKCALVTGAGAGIGQAIAVRLGAEGVAVAVVDRDEQAAREVTAAIEDQGGRAVAVQADVTNRDDVRRAVAAALDLTGVINIVINNAGVIAPAMFPKLDETKFRTVLDVHLMGTYAFCQEALPHIPTDGSGRIINSASAAGITGTIGQANYGAAKAAIIGLTKSLARELAGSAITANVIAPLAATNMTKVVRTDPRFSEQSLARVPLKRWAEPEEIAGSFAFLASEDAGYITGQVLCVDGGLVI